MAWYAWSQRRFASEHSTASRRTCHRRFIVSSVPSDPSRRICPSIGVPVSLAVRRVWSARVAEREPRMAGHAEFVICDQPIDITYIRLRHGWLYLVAILDWFSRYVVSWMLDETLDIGFVLDAIAQARAVATPEIWNTDQGSHFTSPHVTEPLAAAGVQISMDGKGRATDNIFTERLWRSVKYEEVYLADYGSPRDARQGLGRYFTFYNTERPHQALDYRRPADLYFQ